MYRCPRHRRGCRRSWIIGVVAICSVAEPAGATVFYVRAGGRDSADGLSPATAFATIGRAAAAVQNPGDQVVVGPGTFPEGDIMPARSGIEGRLVTLFGDSSGAATGDTAGPVLVMPPPAQTTGFLLLGRHHVLIEGFTIVGAMDSGIQVRSDATGAMSHDVILRGVAVRDCRKSGIQVSAGGEITIEDSVASGNGSAGISIAGAGAVGVTLSILNNQVVRNGTHGIFIAGAMGGSIEGNHADDNAMAGILLRSSSRVSVVGNSINGNQDGISAGTGAEAAASVADVLIADNEVQGTARAGVSVVANGFATLARNTVSNSGASGVSVIGNAATKVSLQDNLIRSSGMDGMLVRGASPLTVAGNTVQESGENGIAIGTGEEGGGSDLVLKDNRVSTSGKAGVTVFASGTFTATGNIVTQSGSTGLSLQAAAQPITPDVSNNTLGVNGAHGLFLQGASAGVVQNNASFSNGATGMTVRASSDVLVANNLVYANALDGLAVGTADLAVANATIINNTLYANGGWGVVLGTSAVSSPGATVVNNLFDLNEEGGITVARSSTCGYVAGFNINPDGYGEGTPRNDYDVRADPLLLNPAGPDRQLGGDGFADDDFRLQQRRGGQTLDSPAVDAGLGPVTVLGLTGTTAKGEVPDRGVVDIGYHYGASANQRLTVPTPEMPIFVRQGGRDTSDGRDPSRALASIQEGARRAAAGGQVIVGPGRYAEGDIHPLQNRGRVTFFADSTGMFTGDLPGTVLVDASGKDTGFTILNACGVGVDGFHVTGSMNAGIQVRAGSTDAWIRNNVVFSNARRGIEISGAAFSDASRGVEISGADDGHIRNNLVYANGTGGIRVAGANDADVLNNTVYGNGDVGILIGGSEDADATLGVAVRRNIVAANGKGIKVQTNSLAGYASGFNIVFGPDSFSGATPRADSDFIADPLFVDPAGPDGILGGAGFLDDDFRLFQGATIRSPAIDVDFGAMNVLAVGSTREDGLPDLGPRDAGYHSAFVPRTPVPRSVQNVVFVRITGSDTRTGQSPDAALASISQALAAVSGDGLVVVGPGTYAVDKLRLGGNGGRVVLVGDTNGALTGDAPGAVVLDAGAGRGPVVLGAALLDGFTLTGGRGPGLRILRAARNVTLRNMTICGNSGSGLATSGDGVRAVNNLVCANGGAGIDLRLRSASRVTQLINNTIAGNARQGVVVRELGSSVSHVRLFNNIVSGNGRVGITARAVRGAAPLIGYNLNTDGYAVRTVPGPGDLAGDPLFAGGPPARDGRCSAPGRYQLRPASPAIDAGFGTPIEIGLGPHSMTVAGSADIGATDLGYHHRP